MPILQTFQSGPDKDIRRILCHMTYSANDSVTQLNFQAMHLKKAFDENLKCKGHASRFPKQHTSIVTSVKKWHVGFLFCLVWAHSLTDSNHNKCSLRTRPGLTFAADHHPFAPPLFCEYLPRLFQTTEQFCVKTFELENP